jgi:hypothetical protein
LLPPVVLTLPIEVAPDETLTVELDGAGCVTICTGVAIGAGLTGGAADGAGLTGGAGDGAGVDAVVVAGADGVGATGVTAFGAFADGLLELWPVVACVLTGATGVVGVVVTGGIGVVWTFWTGAETVIGVVTALTFTGTGVVVVVGAELLVRWSDVLLVESAEPPLLELP